MINHLDAKGVGYTKRQVDDQGLFQLFLMDPNDVKVELNFANEEALEIQADIMAADLPD